MIQIQVLDDRSEIVPYTFPEFSFHARVCRLSEYPGMAAASHWHRDVEFIVVYKGSMAYGVDGREYVLKSGCGIFVNSGRLHGGYACHGEDCTFLCVVLPPSLLESTPAFQQAFLAPLMEDASCPACILDPAVPWQDAVLRQLRALYAYCQEQPPGFGLMVVSCFQQIWYLLYQNSLGMAQRQDTPEQRRIAALHAMVGYIQKYYREKLTVDKIASAGSVCRSGCSAIFRQILHTTPMAYLTDYRIEKSMELLKRTRLTATEIALQCGFGGSSYFAEVFGDKVGCTPTAYRRANGTLFHAPS